MPIYYGENAVVPTQLTIVKDSIRTIITVGDIMERRNDVITLFSVRDYTTGVVTVLICDEFGSNLYEWQLDYYLREVDTYGIKTI